MLNLLKMNIKLINQRPLFDSAGNELNFAISAKSAPTNLTSEPVIGTGITYNVSYPFSVFSGSSELIISADTINSGRLYVGYGTLPSDASGNTAPLPLGDQYFGWVEFSKMPADQCVWINLSNVDLVGMPLTLSGSSGWSLGYKNSMADLQNDLATAFPGAVIECSGGNKKIVGPDIIQSAYTSFDSYFSSLSSATANLCINTDTLSDGNQKQFIGSFNNNLGAIVLFSAPSDMIVIYYSALTSDIVYRCDGSTLYYNGNEYPVNRSGSTDSDITTNSVFRNLLIGFNEGYFEPYPTYTSDGLNYSLNYSFLKPFGKDGKVGNMYAKMIHDNSNSYGFPYADSNLKTLIQAPLTDSITLTVIPDNLSGYCYQNDEQSTQNSPGDGFFQFSFGSGCQSLGNINIGNCNYPATTSYAGNGGFLPQVTEFVPMVFNCTGGTKQHIWINPGTLEYSMYDASGKPCIIYDVSKTANVPQKNYITAETASKEIVLTGVMLAWGGTSQWNPEADNAVRPS